MKKLVLAAILVLSSTLFLFSQSSFYKEFCKVEVYDLDNRLVDSGPLRSIVIIDIDDNTITIENPELGSGTYDVVQWSEPKDKEDKALFAKCKDNTDTWYMAIRYETFGMAREGVPYYMIFYSCKL